MYNQIYKCKHTMSVSASFACYTTFTILDKGQSYQQKLSTTYLIVTLLICV